MPGGCVRRWFRPAGLFQQAADNACVKPAANVNNKNPSGSFKEVIRQAVRPQDTAAAIKAANIPVNSNLFGTMTPERIPCLFLLCSIANGKKAVCNYWLSPDVLSGDRHFCIHACMLYNINSCSLGY